MISEIKDGKVIVEMSEDQAKILMEFFGAQTGSDVVDYIESHDLDLDDVETYEVFYDLYDVLSDLYEENEEE